MEREPDYADMYRRLAGVIYRGLHVADPAQARHHVTLQLTGADLMTFMELGWPHAALESQPPRQEEVR